MDPIVYINDNPKRYLSAHSSYAAIVGDLLRLVALYLLGCFVLSKKQSSLKQFLLVYSLSSFLIGFFAYHHGHDARGLSEWILAVVFLVFYVRY